jgi:hypothetical protein
LALAGGLTRRPGGPALVLAGLLGAPVPLPAQPEPVRYALRHADLVVAPDSRFGLHVLVVPRPGSGEGREPVWLRFAPAGVLDWVNGAAQALRVAGAGGPARAIQWSPRLAPLGPAAGEGGLLLGRSRRDGELGRERWLAVADTAPGWQLELSAAEADSVLRLLFALAPLAGQDSAEAPAEADQVDRRAGPLDRGRLPRGLALVQYIVAADGSVEPGSIRFLWSSASRVERELRALLLAQRGTPAVRNGAPVRQVVRAGLGR